MAYESLYRRYRPRRFGEVRGQSHVVRALSNAVRENRVGHAYLFSGPRGTGKTSTARILAKALNCTNLLDGEPCGECDSCVAIEAGTSYDLLELDAASNNGVDAMRDLIAKAALGSPGRTKVYLLDEVHMLSAGASNALLKTLEEPPGHVVFVLATTDPHKVLPTIRSRTQHFELHLLPAEELRALVDDVVADAGLDLDDDAIDYALRTGGGSARDTLSALDQVVAAGGVLDRGDEVDDLVDALAAGDTGAALREVAEAVRRGHDPRVVGEALLARVRDIFLRRMGDPLDQISDAARAKVLAWAEGFSDRGCTRALEGIGDALRDMRSAPDARIPLEVALVRLTRASTDTTLEGLAARIERLERGAVGDVDRAPSPTAAAAPGAVDEPEGTPEEPSGPTRPADAARAALAPRRTPDTGAKERRAPEPPPRPRPPAERGGAPPVAPGAGDTPPEPVETAPAPSVPTAPAATNPEPDRAPTGSADVGDVTELTRVWSESILPRLSGLTKAMFSVGHFTRVAGDKATFVVPNSVHRDKSMQKLGEVEAALAAQLGRDVSIELTVDEDSGAARPAPDRTAPARDRTRPTEGPSQPPQPGPGESAGGSEDFGDIGPVSELDDAPADDRSAAQRIVDTFPGAEVVDRQR